MAFRRRTIVFLLVTAGIFLAAVGLALVFIDSDRYRPQVISYLQSKTGKQIEIGHFSIIWVPLSVRLDDFGLRNPKPFPSGYFLKSKRIDVAIDAAALMRREVVIKSMVLYEPIINVVSDPDGLWNFENPPLGSSRKDTPIFDFGIIPQVQITGGEVLGSSLIDPSDSPGPVVFEARNVSSMLRQVDFNSFTNLSSVKTSSSPVAQGDLKADSLRFGSIKATNVKSKLRLLTKQISFDDVSVDADQGRATGELSFDLSGDKAHFSSNVKLNGLDVAHFLNAFPEGRGKMTGTMEGQVKLAGAIEHTASPLQGVRANGNLTVRDGKIPGLNSDDNFRKMTRFRDATDATRDPSAFSSFSSDVGLANQQISSQQVNIMFYGVEVQCAGDLGLLHGGTLKYQGKAKILKKQGFFTNIFSKMLHEAKEENGKLIFPFRVSGTMGSPKFALTD